VTAHVVFTPEWAIELDGRGSFRVECDCGWHESGFDTSSLARAAGFAHSTGQRGDAGTTAGASAPAAKRRWWRR
jgi:hypothetical protein